VKRLTAWFARTVIDFDQRWLLALASGIAASNIIANTLVVTRLLSPDGYLLPSTTRLIYAYNLGSVLLATALSVTAWKCREFRLPLKPVHFLLAALVLEAFVRINLFTDWTEIRWLKNPRLYATGRCGDESYHVLAHYYTGDLPPRLPVDRRVGWTAGGGPLRIIGSQFSDPSEVRPRPILFFGDSFVAFGEELEHKIPQMLDHDFPQHDVLNFGVPGYAADQISLRFQYEYPRFAKKEPVVLVGMLLDDLDRSLLEYRKAQKPFYELSGKDLVLHEPRYSTNEEYVDRYSFHHKSFLLSLLTTRGAELLSSETWCSSERVELNRAIFRDMIDFARSRDVDIYLVVFYNHSDLKRRSPMERELKAILGELELDNVIDTKPILLRHIEGNGGKLVDLYGGSGHHTETANRIVADGIGSYLRQSALR